MAIIRIQCLKEHFIPFTKLNTDWKGDKRYPEQAIQRFIAYNKDVFSFLGVSASLDEVNFEKGLRIIASNYIGAAPLRKPSSGKYYTDIQITSRFGENVSEIVYLLKDVLEPDFLDKNLYHKDQLSAPFYFDCVNYFNSFLKAIQEPWNKFDTIKKVESHPCSSTNWSKYSIQSINPDNALKFENKKNILSREHKEWQELIYVLNIAIYEFESIKTPLSIRLRCFSVVSALKRYLNVHSCIKPITKFQLHSYEPAIIGELKTNANKLLEHNTENSKSWRIDSAELFERYVQYIMIQIGKINNANVICNNKFTITGNHLPTWTLRYLEPDIIFNKKDALYFVDAKYKSHMLNLQSSSGILKEAFREDLHQILAYSSFDTSKYKSSILIYPCDKLKILKLDAINNIKDIHNYIYLIGIPFTTVGYNKLVKQLSEVLKLA